MDADDINLQVLPPLPVSRQLQVSSLRWWLNLKLISNCLERTSAKEITFSLLLPLSSNQSFSNSRVGPPWGVRDAFLGLVRGRGGLTFLKLSVIAHPLLGVSGALIVRMCAGEYSISSKSGTSSCSNSK